MLRPFSNRLGQIVQILQNINKLPCVVFKRLARYSCWLCALCAGKSHCSFTTVHSCFVALRSRLQKPQPSVTIDDLNCPFNIKDNLFFSFKNFFCSLNIRHLVRMEAYSLNNISICIAPGAAEHYLDNIIIYQTNVSNAQGTSNYFPSHTKDV